MSTTCNQPAVYRYTWPGRDESVACVVHAIKLKTIAEMMGFHLQLLPLPLESTAICPQRIDARIVSTPDTGNLPAIPKDLLK